jgi:hypothetical protein
MDPVSDPVRLRKDTLLLLLGPELYSASNRNEYQKISGIKVRQDCKADNLTAICEPIV